MPWIEAPHEDDWGEDLEPIRREVIDPRWGRVDWIMRIHSLDAGSLIAHNVLYRHAMQGTATLRKVDREMIAVVVSSINECHY
jgi:hypothetical protein